MTQDGAGRTAIANTCRAPLNFGFRSGGSPSVRWPELFRRPPLGSPRVYSRRSLSFSTPPFCLGLPPRRSSYVLPSILGSCSLPPSHHLTAPPSPCLGPAWLSMACGSCFSPPVPELWSGVTCPQGSILHPSPATSPRISISWRPGFHPLGTLLALVPAPPYTYCSPSGRALARPTCLPSRPLGPPRHRSRALLNFTYHY